MMRSSSSFLTWNSETREAMALHRPVVALESAVITHGLPYPENVQLALDMENEIRSQGAIPATVAVLEGKIRIGLRGEEIELLAKVAAPSKISRRDLAAVINTWGSGGTTVAGTLPIARQAGIHVFATGGIGGVHRGNPFDVSADLHELACSPLIVVCAGAKAIVDIPATLEVLESYSVPVIGYRTAEFPAFYSLSSGLPLSIQVVNPGEIAGIALTHWNLGSKSAILVANPPPQEVALDRQFIEGIIEKVLLEAQRDEIHGQLVTPYLLKRVTELSGGESLKTNLALLKNNARLAAQVARSLVERIKGGTIRAV